jgi:hypothetical protein
VTASLTFLKGKKEKNLRAKEFFGCGGGRGALNTSWPLLSLPPLSSVNPKPYIARKKGEKVKTEVPRSDGERQVPAV